MSLKEIKEDMQELLDESLSQIKSNDYPDFVPESREYHIGYKKK